MKIPFLALTLILAAPASAATHMDYAQPSKANATAARPAGDVFASYDMNKDGWLSRAELARHPMAEHAGMVDLDKDGRLTRAEFKQLQSM